MTEAAGKELSDVLTSLRKLVADEPDHTVHTTEDTPKGSDTLVLCPSLRVDDSEIATPPSLEDKITKLERLIANTDQLWEPDDVDQDEFAGSSTAVPAAFIAPSKALEAVEDDIAQLADTVVATAPDDLDEAALRELVAEMIRDELRGALGEKITKNIRKLVRREINSALLKQRIE